MYDGKSMHNPKSLGGKGQMLLLLAAGTAVSWLCKSKGLSQACWTGARLHSCSKHSPTTGTCFKGQRRFRACDCRDHKLAGPKSEPLGPPSDLVS